MANPGHKSHKGKARIPTLVVGGTSSQESFRSADERRTRMKIGVVEDTAGLAEEPTRWYQEDLATSVARGDPKFSYQLGYAVSCEPDNETGDGIEVVLGPAQAKRFPNADRPLKAWYTHCDDYVYEQLCHEGRGSARVYARCSGVRCNDPGGECPNRRCGVAAHSQLPTHFIEHWNGAYFVHDRTALRDLSVRTQLNHPPGVVCPFRQSGPVDFVLYDISGIHEISVDFCGCRTEDGTPEGGAPLEHQMQLLRACWWPATVHSPKTCATFSVLRQFQALNCLGKLSAYDFLRGLEKCTNHNGLNKPPDRRKPFMHIVRQWREVKRMKRFKRGHTESGVRGTGQGELALMCCACPQPGWNLPEGWEKINPLYRFIYWLFLAQDANFRLSNRNVSSEVADPIWGDGFGFFCKQEGPDGYKAHIAKHVNEAEVSNCSGFQAMFMANTKRTKGLRTTGVGGLRVRVTTCGGETVLEICKWGKGERQATLEDIFGFHNYDRVLAMHRVLPKRLAVNMQEAVKHQIVFDDFSRGLEQSRPDQLAQWREAVHIWETKAHPKSEESPFGLVEEVTTLREIQLAIATEEFLCTEEGTEIEHEHSPGAFVTMGMDLEEVQRKLEIDVRALKDPSVAQKLAFTKRRTALLRRIHKFRQVQGIYMPTLRMQLSNEQKEVYDGDGDLLPEATRLFMPSELSASVRLKVCVMGVAEIEARLRYGEACEALDAVRHGLRTRTMTNHYKLRNFTGQGMMTKGQGLLHQINIKIHAAKVRYHYARAALLVLRGHGDWEKQLRVLGDDDVRALNECALTTEEKAQNEHWEELGALRLEWSKAYARAKRLSEEVRLLREEMRRTIAFGRTEAEKWGQLAQEEIHGSTPELTEGRRAYAAEHADIERRTCAKLEQNWAGILAKADAYLDGTAPLESESLVTVELELGDELDLEDEEAQLEADED
ncbi:hypothetical protein K438DRAFT_1997396 [Mycena galopus ATCC 62051]|nr:hypothetical protein K438DRAFT_1997396 [Mycena galopus ATCC 62051]